MIDATSRALLEDMVTYARAALARLKVGRDELDEVRAESILWNMTLLGEAATHVSKTVMKRYPQIRFDSARYMRNRLVHGYRTIEFEIVRSTALNDLPPLIAAIERLLAEEPE